MSQDDGDRRATPDPATSSPPLPAADESAEPTRVTPTVHSLGLSAEGFLPVVLGASAIAAALSGQAPTGTPVADFVLPAAVGAIVPWFMRRDSGRSLLIAAVLALFFSGFSMPSIALAGGALAIALVVGARPFDADSHQILVASGSALVVQAALRLPNLGWTYTASIFATIALSALLIGGWRSLHDDNRRLAGVAALVLGGFVVVACLSVGLAGLVARGDVERSIDQAERGIDALEAGDQDTAAALLRDAAEGFADAHAVLAGPLAWPSRVVPVVAQHSRALEVAANEGRNLAQAAVQTVTTADVDQIRGNNGAIDLELVDEVAREIAVADRVLTTSRRSLREVRNQWLLPLLDDRLADVDEQLVDVQQDIDLAAEAMAVVPAVLGSEGPRTYLVLFVQPAEGREYGGFVGAYGLLEADRGRLSLLESGSFDTDLWRGEAFFTDGGSVPEHYFNKLPHVFPQNLTAIADLSTIAAAAADLAPQWRNDPGLGIDGVMTIDPFALAGFLELTGPIAIQDRDEPLDSSNVADYLLREQYLDFDDDELDVRRDGLRELAGVAFGELLSIEIPGPERLGAIFGPLARQNRLAFTTFDEAENAFFRRIFLDADLPIVGDDVSMLGVFHATGVAGKLDAYTSRHIDYRVEIDPTAGAAIGELAITMRNDAPVEAPDYVLGLGGLDMGDYRWQPGDNVVALNLYSRDEIGPATSSDTVLEESETLPALTYDHRNVTLIVPQGTERTVRFPVAGTVSDGSYRLVIPAQPSALTATFSVEISVTPGWRITDGDGEFDDTTLVASGDLSEGLELGLVFDATEG